MYVYYAPVHLDNVVCTPVCTGPTHLESRCMLTSFISLHSYRLVRETTFGSQYVIVAEDTMSNSLGLLVDDNINNMGVEEVT